MPLDNCSLYASARPMPHNDITSGIWAIASWNVSPMDGRRRKTHEDEPSSVPCIRQVGGSFCVFPTHQNPAHNRIRLMDIWWDSPTAPSRRSRCWRMFFCNRVTPSCVSRIRPCSTWAVSANAASRIAHRLSDGSGGGCRTSALGKADQR